MSEEKILITCPNCKNNFDSHKNLLRVSMGALDDLNKNKGDKE